MLNKNIAQGTVEYLILLAVVASITLGLLSSTGMIKNYLSMAKITARDRLSGQNLELTRYDFVFKAPKIATSTGQTTTEGETTGEGGGGEEGERARMGQKQELQTQEAESPQAETSTKSRQDTTTTGIGLGEAEASITQNEIDMAKTQERFQGMSDEEIRRELALEQLNMTAKSKEEKDREGLASIFTPDEASLSKEKKTGGFDWGFLKIIIIILAIGFFIFMFIRAKSAK